MRILVAAACWETVALARSLDAEGFLVSTAETWADLLYMAGHAAHDAVVHAQTFPRPCPATAQAAVAELRPQETGALVVRAEGETAPLYQAGADVVSPAAEPARLLARRIRAAVMRRRGHVPPVARAGQIEIDVIAAELRVAGQPVPLTPLQYEIVERLALAAGRMVSRETLLDALYGWENEPGARVLDTFLHDIRRRVSDAGGNAHVFQTRRGAGFQLGAGEPMREAG